MRRRSLKVVLGLVVVATSCSESSIGINLGPEISLTPASAAIVVGDSVRFTATLIGRVDKGTTWSMSDARVITINQAGWARGVGVGTASITVASVANPNVRALASVTVNAAR